VFARLLANNTITDPRLQPHDWLEHTVYNQSQKTPPRPPRREQHLLGRHRSCPRARVRAGEEVGWAGLLGDGWPDLPDVFALLELLDPALLGGHAQAQRVESGLHLAHREVHRRAHEPQVVTHALPEARGLVVGRGDC